MTTCRRPASTQHSRGRTPSGWSGCRWERDREWGGTLLAASRDWRLQGDLGPLSPSTSGQRSSARDVWLWVPPEAATAGEESNELDFVVGARQHPQQGPLLPGSGGGGGEINPFGGCVTLFLSFATHFGGAVVFAVLWRRTCTAHRQNLRFWVEYDPASAETTGRRGSAGEPTGGQYPPLFLQ